MAYLNYKTEEDLAESIKDKLREAGISTEDGTTGSISDVLASAIGSEIFKLGEDFDIALSEESLENASGESLDRYASNYFAGSLTRLAESKASSLSEEFNVSLTNSTNNDITISQGEVISNSTDREVSFLLLEDYTVPANSSVYVSVEAEEIGTGYNIGTGYLNDIEVSGITVTQEKAITNGSFRETDEEFKNRIASLGSINGLKTERLINLSGISYPGKFNAEYKANYYGPGISGVFSYYENIQPEEASTNLSNVLREYSYETRETKLINARKLNFIIYTENTLDGGKANEIKNNIKNNYAPGSNVNFTEFLGEESNIKKIEIEKDNLFFDTITEVNNSFIYNSDVIELIDNISFIYEGDDQWVTVLNL